MEKHNIITKEKLQKYFNLTETALEKIKPNIIKGKESEAKEIIEMVENYLSDAKYFQKNNDYVNCFASLNYSHGWIDCGVRTGIFDVNDDRLFTVK
ncbi:MAG TPA: DUF357 domain-containing protein [Candidatus Nanoarchaeia archaeon]|nr:DUF357 domain-containing protein [Candidatus Nanoarchaeia archaeon]